MDSHETNAHPIDHNQTQYDAISEINRREFLKKAGKFAVYTPPALMLLMQPSYAKIARSSGSQGEQTSTPKSSVDQGAMTSYNRQPYHNFLQEIREWLIRFFSYFRS